MIKAFKHKDEAESFWERTTFCRLQHIEKRWRRKLETLDATPNLMALSIVPGNNLEKLKTEKRKGQHSIRINDQYRICFEWRKDNHAYEVETVDYHDEKK
jgi:proteic killer suppression protein